ncbi:hypothetical protein LCGC14_0997220 [marine sediment metagenome]|uniref:Uncharacterized protein n=1 Tax=marine sediment metagenome TaxID=412755 RepID=A0A0F9N434_9ZZZZ
MKLVYKDYCDYLANKCQACKGEKRIWSEGIPKACACQYLATAKWQFEQISINPPHLKYKKWSDFTGEIRDKDGKVVTFLEQSYFTKAKQQAMKYCFGSSDPKVLKDPSKYSVIQKRLQSGQNIIISGGHQTGKTLIAALVVKEVLRAAILHRISVDFQWVKSADVLYAATWANAIDPVTGEFGSSIKSIDYPKIEEWASTDFLVIDSIELRKYGHTGLPDSMILNKLFTERINKNKPTILICSLDFKLALKTLSSEHHVKKVWGEVFAELASSDDIFVIELKTDG